MPNPVWPAGLPQDVLTDGFGEQLAEVVLRTQMDAGPAKMRRRFTAGVRVFNVATSLTRTEAATFETFFGTTLLGGALAFDWVHPRTLATVAFRFRKAPTLRPEPGAKLWRAEMELEVLP